MPRLRLAMAQTNPIVGDLLGNSERLLELATDAYSQGAQVFVTGELALTGYPIEDLAPVSYTHLTLPTKRIV